MSLAFLLFDFVAAEVFLSLGEDNVLAQNRIVFAEAKLVWSVHSILLCVILTNTRFFRNQANELAFSIILLCHNILYFITTSQRCKQGNPVRFLKVVLGVFCMGPEL